MSFTPGNDTTRYTEAESAMMMEQSYAQQLNGSNDGQSSATGIKLRALSRYRETDTVLPFFFNILFEEIIVKFLYLFPFPLVTSTAGTQTMELQENAPVIYANTTVITMQPGEGNRFLRRPIPIITDWVSTPRQLNAVSGTQFLTDVEQLEIQQVIDLPTLIGRPEQKTQYRVKVPHAETLFLATESKSETQSRMYGWYKGFVFNVLDACGEVAFVIRKEPSWIHIPGSRQKITVESADLIGSVEKNFSLIGPSFTVYNAFKEPLCNIYGPNVSGCCMYKEAQFQVTSLDGSHQVATLMHQWDHLTVDYILLLTFPMETDVKLKSLLLGASFLIEYLYFERIRRASRR